MNPLAPVVLALALVVAPAVGAAPLSPAQTQTLTRIEDYLNRITTLKARFAQFSGEGRQAAGTFYLSRPGRLRIDYDPPVPVRIQTQGSFLVYQDLELEQHSHIPIGSSPVDLLLRPSIDFFDPEITIIGLERQDRSIALALSQSEDPGAGSLTLIFDTDPLRLSRWMTVDPQGTQILVVLQNEEYGGALPDELFDYRDPRHGLKYR